MGTIALQTPVVDAQLATEAPKIASDFTTLQTLVNGNVDENNISAGLAQSAGVNVGGVGAKGVCVNAGPGTRTNTAYGALNDAADQVAGVVLPSNGLIAVWFQATWKESVSGGANASIFLGANQVKVASSQGGALTTIDAVTSGANVNVNETLASGFQGLRGQSGHAGGAYAGDATTGQMVGVVGFGGPTYIFAAAGTYTVSVQYKAASGTVTASNRRLWVKAESFA